MKISTLGSIGLRLALAFAAAVVDSSKASPGQKAAAVALLDAGDKFVAAFSA